MAKFTLIAVSILASQIALCVVLGKCIRAGGGPDLDEDSRDSRELDRLLSSGEVPSGAPLAPAAIHDDWLDLGSNQRGRTRAER